MAVDNCTVTSNSISALPGQEVAAGVVELIITPNSPADIISAADFYIGGAQNIGGNQWVVGNVSTAVNKVQFIDQVTNTVKVKVYHDAFTMTALSQDLLIDIDRVSTKDAVLGCTDPNALNYMPGATVNDGSCIYPANMIAGCTDPTASNYDPDAEVNDGSCLYQVFGCTDPAATNYNAEANINDGSCEYNEDPEFDGKGCTDPAALNFNPAAFIDDGSCIFEPKDPIDPVDPTDPVESDVCPGFQTHSIVIHDAKDTTPAFMGMYWMDYEEEDGQPVNLVKITLQPTLAENSFTSSYEVGPIQNWYKSGEVDSATDYYDYLSYGQEVCYFAPGVKTMIRSYEFEAKPGTFFNAFTAKTDLMEGENLGLQGENNQAFSHEITVLESNADGLATKILFNVYFGPPVENPYFGPNGSLIHYPLTHPTNPGEVIPATDSGYYTSADGNGNPHYLDGGFTVVWFEIRHDAAVDDPIVNPQIQAVQTEIIQVAGPNTQPIIIAHSPDAEAEVKVIENSTGETFDFETKSFTIEPTALIIDNPGKSVTKSEINYPKAEAGKSYSVEVEAKGKTILNPSVPTKENRPEPVVELANVGFEVYSISLPTGVTESSTVYLYPHGGTSGLPANKYYGYVNPGSKDLASLIAIDSAWFDQSNLVNWDTGEFTFAYSGGGTMTKRRDAVNADVDYDWRRPTLVPDSAGDYDGEAIFHFYETTVEGSTLTLKFVMEVQQTPSYESVAKINVSNFITIT